MARVRQQTPVNLGEKRGTTAPTRTAPRANGNLYERDYYSWAIGQSRALRDRKDSKLDWENLAEEVEDLAKDEKRLQASVGELQGHLNLTPAREQQIALRAAGANGKVEWRVNGVPSRPL